MAIDDPTRDSATLSPSTDSETPRSGASPTLKAGSIGIVAVLFMAIANAAPITAMTGNVPISIGFGNGIYTPGGFLVATAILTLFTIGYVQMAKHITTAGAFYGFISHGLGAIWGMASGMLATMAYIVFEGSLAGVFAYFADDAFNQWFGGHVNWLLLAGGCIAVTGVFGYFDISLAAVVLGVFLVCEVVLLSALSLSVLFKGGGPTGLHVEALNPIKSFSGLPAGMKQDDGTAIAGGSAAIGLFFAFWSWVGYETTAVYGEESRNPRKIVPRATMCAVIGLGLFYTFVSWMVIAGAGPSTAIKESAGGEGIPLFTDLAAKNLGGHWIVNVYLFLLMSGSFACALAFHNAASRYLFAIGREVPSWRRHIGAAHPKHGSPHIASIAQTAVTAVLTAGFYFLTVNGSNVAQGGYTYEFGLLALLGTMAILIVQSICSVSVIWYFHVKKAHPGNLLTTGIIPGLGCAGMLYVVYLLFSNLSFAGGGASKSPFFHAIPWIAAATFIFGALGVLWLRATKPEVYSSIGRTVLEETRERV